MPVSIPFLKSDTNYTLIVPIDDQQVLFDVRWNSRDEAFYVDMYQADDVIIALNIKLVLGVQLGRRSHHTFFQEHSMTVADTSDRSEDAGFDDLGDRIVVLVQSKD